MLQSSAVTVVPAGVLVTFDDPFLMVGALLSTRTVHSPRHSLPCDSVIDENFQVGDGRHPFMRAAVKPGLLHECMGY